MLPLFDDPPSFDRDALAARLRELAAGDIWIGTSSWKYPGWLDQIYRRDRYTVRNKFSKKRFETECLAEYSEVFPIVCGDFSFYQFPAPEFWERFFATAPRLQVALKVPEDITVREFPSHPRYGPRGGTDNPTFLDAGLFQAAFTEVLAPYANRVAVLIFEFGTFAKRHFDSADAFIDSLAPFLDQLPAGFRYSVEVRNSEFLTPAYFDCLSSHGIAHVFNSWTRMPPLAAQIRLPGAFTTGFTVTRALLRPGRPYEEAVEKFSPYETIKEEDPEARAALRALIQHAQDKRRTAYIFVNNRFEGNAPTTIESVIND